MPNPRLRRRRQTLLAAVTLAIVLPVAGCVMLAARQAGLSRSLRQAQAEIEQLKAAQQEIPMEETSPQENEAPSGPSILESQPSSGGPAPEYQSLFPDLYVEGGLPHQQVQEKTVFLTFDDGPSENTPAILDALDKAGAKATFFVVGTQVGKHPEYLKQAAERGHAIGIHTESHKYGELYDSVEAYLTDFNAAYQRVVEVTGQKPEIFRFPGGSINQYSKGIYQELIAEMLRRGFVYYDWNVSAEDAVGDPTVQSIVDNVFARDSLRMPVVLMHDGAYTKATAEALPSILEKYKSLGYSFGRLTRDVTSVSFAYKY